MRGFMRRVGKDTVTMMAIAVENAICRSRFRVSWIVWSTC